MQDHERLIFDIFTVIIVRNLAQQIPVDIHSSFFRKAKGEHFKARTQERTLFRDKGSPQHVVVVARKNPEIGLRLPFLGFCLTVRVGKEVATDRALQIFRLEFAKAEIVADLLGNLFAEQSATIVADMRTNAVIVGAKDGKVLKSIATVLMALDVPTKDK